MKFFDPEKVPAYLRTVVPTLWGTFIAWLVLQIPALPTGVVEFLQEPVVVSAVAALFVWLWYAVWRYVEPRTPVWLTRLVLGSNLTPQYQGVEIETSPIDTAAPFYGPDETNTENQHG